MSITDKDKKNKLLDLYFRSADFKTAPICPCETSVTL